MLVREIMTPNPVTIKPGNSCEEAAAIFLQNKFDTLPVVDNYNKLIGIFTRANIIRAYLNGDDSKTKIEDLMIKNVISIFPDESLEETWKAPVSTLPVITQEGILVGILTRDDLIRAFYSEAGQIKDELTTILESAHNGIVAINNIGKIVTFNSAAERILGIKAENAIGKDVEEITLSDEFFDVVKSGKPQYGQKQVIGSTTIVTNRTPIIKDNKVVGAVAIFQDISEIENISKELSAVKALNKELDAIIESSYDGIYITDGDGITLRANSSFERITGVKESWVKGRSIQELIKQGIFTDSVTLETVKRRKPVTILQGIGTGNKSGLKVMVTGSPIFDDGGNVEQVVINVRDITELNNVKQQLERSKELTMRYHSELEHLRTQQLKLDNVVAQSAEMKKVFSLAIRVAQVDSTVLITGESGSGKEVVAKNIHKNSKRKDGPLIQINCGAIPENLLESELFGYEAGAFTGARKEGKLGMFELAENGTLFLDEIGELPLNLQVKLLRVLQEREIIRVGGVKPIKINVRIIAATNKDLEKMIEKGTFREDLFYRLNVVMINIPPLRERKNDIPPLIHHFLRKFNQKYEMNKKISSEVMDRLIAYDWPGNVREVENFIERLVVMVIEDIIELKHLPEFLQSNIANSHFQVSISGIIPLKKASEDLEKQLISKALKKYGTTRKAAEILQVDQATVVRKSKKYNISNEIKKR
jgi:PAS domain S-box-containing protein